MLAHEELRVVPATIHVPISEVPAMITSDLLVTTGRIVAHSLRPGSALPSRASPLPDSTRMRAKAARSGWRISISWHQRWQQLKFEGISVEGPVPADTLFHLPHWRKYDAVIAMYHDQALIPIKTVAFDEAVNVTLGLPIVRTSPDHGTAFDLAGTGKGSDASFLAALRLADQLTSGALKQQVGVVAPSVALRVRSPLLGLLVEPGDHVGDFFLLRRDDLLSPETLPTDRRHSRVSALAMSMAPRWWGIIEQTNATSGSEAVAPTIMSAFICAMPPIRSPWALSAAIGAIIMLPPMLVSPIAMPA